MSSAYRHINKHEQQLLLFTFFSVKRFERELTDETSLIILIQSDEDTFLSQYIQPKLPHILLHCSTWTALTVSKADGGTFSCLFVYTLMLTISYRNTDLKVGFCRLFGSWVTGMSREQRQECCTRVQTYMDQQIERNKTRFMISETVAPPSFTRTKIVSKPLIRHKND